MIVLVVHWEADAGKEADMVNTFTRLAAESRKEPGCRLYVVHRHKDAPRRFLVYEQYEDEAALQRHRDSAHFQQFAVTDLPRVGKRLEADVYNALD